jgi:hypothetical protein
VFACPPNTTSGKAVVSGVGKLGKQNPSRPHRCRFGAEAAPPIPHRGRHPTSMAHPAGAPSANPIARPGLGTWPAVPRSPQGGDGPRGRLRRQVPRRGASQRGGERTPTRRAPSGVVANARFHAVLGYHPHATLPGRGAPCVQLSGDLRPGEASPPKPNDPHGPEVFAILRSGALSCRSQSMRRRRRRSA